MRSFVVLFVLGWCVSACAAGHDSPLTAAGDAGLRDANEPTEPQEPVDAGAAPDQHEPAPPDDDPLKPMQPRDAGVKVLSPDAGEHDAGTSPGVDAGKPQLDAGAFDAGNPQLDSGTHAFDAGHPAQDAGQPALDAGHPAMDSGTDAGQLDASTPDASQPAIDAGTPDAGNPVVDAGPAAPSCFGPPGLYKDDKCQVLSDGIKVYHPQYPLWSDGANKERFVYLPPGTRIDTSNPDRWSFPKGTRFYKTFASGALKVETRVMEKTATTTGFDSWTLTSYAWSADQLSVSPASANGVTNALGTALDIPSQAQCRSCHNMTGADATIGFNAIQLNHQDGGVMLSDLLNQNLLVNGSSGAALNISLSNTRIPGDASARAALGYLHGNCGHCHGGPSPRAGQRLWSVVGMTQLADAPIMQSAVCHCLESWTGRKNASGDAYVLRVAPSHAAISGIIGRMSQRGAGEQMPPLGTKVVDATGLAAVKTWITALDGTSCDAVPPVCVP